MSERSETTDEEFQRIEEICDDFLGQLRAGKKPDLQEIAASHPDLAPKLEDRLKLLEAVFRVTKSSGDLLHGASLGSHDSIEDDFLVAKHSVEISRTDPTRKGGFFQNQAQRISCPHCGNVVQLVSNVRAELTCGSCGSDVPLDPEATATDLHVELPQQIGRFQVIRLLGEGAFGAVYCAYDPQLKREVAIKVPRAGYFQTSAEQQRFFREAQSAAKLHHPNIVPVHEISQDSSTPWIVSELIDGVTMSDLASTGLLTFKEIAKLLVTVCDAVGHAHRNGVIHRDLKPSNILIDAHRNPWVADFGLARRDDAEITMTMDGMVLGTPAYMSPEQAAGIHQKVDARSDIYSLGVVLYKLLARELPFSGTRRMLLHQVIHDDPQSPRKFNDNIPRDLETITLKALSKIPAERFQSAEEFKAELQRWLLGEPIHSRPVSPAVRFWKWCKRYPLVASLCASIATLLLAGSAFAWHKANREANLRSIAENHAAETVEQKEESESRLHRIYQSNGREAMDDNRLIETGYWIAKSLAIEDRAVDRDRLGILFERTPKLKAIFPIDSQVQSLSFSGDGRRIAIGTSDGSVTIFDLLTKDLLFESKTLDSFPVHQLDFLQSGTCIAFKCSMEETQIWNIETRQLIRRLNHSKLLLSVAIGLKGEVIASASNGNRVQVLKVNTGELIREFKIDRQANRLEFTSEEKLLVGSTSKDDQHDGYLFELWDVSNGKRIWDRTFPSRAEMSLSRTGDRLATVHANQKVDIWNIATGARVGKPFESSVEIRRFWFSDSEESIQLLSDDRQIQSISFENEKPSIKTSYLDFRPGSWTQVDNCGLVAATNQNGAIQFLERGVWEEAIPKIPGTKQAPKIAFNANGYEVAIEGLEHVQVWDLASALPDYLEFNHEGIARNCLFSANGTRCYTIGHDGKAYIWDATTGKRIGKVMSHDDIVNECALSPDGHLFATVGYDKYARIWDAITGEPVGSPLPHADPVLELAFSPDSRRLVTGCQSGTCFGWNLLNNRTGKPEPVYSFKHSGEIRRIEFASNGGFFATAAYAGDVRFWESETGSPIGAASPSGVLDFSLSPDGKFFVTSDIEHKIKLWTVEDSSNVTSFEIDEIALDVEFVSDKCFKASDLSGATSIWQDDGNGFRLKRSFSHSSLAAHNYSSYLPKKNYVASAGGILNLKKNGTGGVVLWDTEDGHLIAPPLLHDAEVIRAHFNFKGDRILSSASDGAVRLWRLDSPHATEKIAQLFESLYEILDPTAADQGNDTHEKIEKLMNDHPELFEVSTQQRDKWKKAFERPFSVGKDNGKAKKETESNANESR